MPETFALYKLIVLYMLDQVEFPLTNGQISEFILGKGYTNYFKLQQSISDMVQAEFVVEEQVHSRTLYHITPSGKETVKFFGNRLSPGIQKDIDTYIREKKLSLKNEVATKADFYETANQEFAVRCQVFENGTSLIDLTLTVPTQTEAETISNHWKTKSQEVYAMIMHTLL